MWSDPHVVKKPAHEHDDGKQVVMTISNNCEGRKPKNTEHTLTQHLKAMMHQNNN